MLITTLIALQSTRTGLDTRHVLVVNVPVMSDGKTPQQVVDFYKQSISRINAIPGVNTTAFGMNAPSRHGGIPFQFSAHGHVPVPNQDPRAQMRCISPGSLAALAAPIIAGRAFNHS